MSIMEKIAKNRDNLKNEVFFLHVECFNSKNIPKNILSKDPSIMLKIRKLIIYVITINK
jgi:hypothetical protein